ncbi:flagellar hook-basal body complex protein FliE [Chitinasiproducens palmae]|uniref:Flagellar hook-basal body complex protein FliE n=1 Tax=Chitinasiproducens palmae TaxID=1770053 RepID=A0A1H2PJL2_9BURK|nr:flagellar hook-basal body complex protein FliE [Chitinasiproducens palmae]SDV46580.1 flagellar hook-basal body complex protein FliE [Chitinasiproducens palmae]
MESSINPMGSALSQLRALASEAAGVPATGRAGKAAGVGKTDGAGLDEAGGVGGTDFASVLKQSLDKVNASQQSALGQARAFEMGSSDVSLSDVMIDMQKANINFQTAVQVRNKLVSAYSEIMQMQV